MINGGTGMIKRGSFHVVLLHNIFYFNIFGYAPFEVCEEKHKSEIRRKISHDKN
jgi:hypothetical protein